MGSYAERFSPAWIPEILDKIPLAVTIIDLQGIMLNYNEYASRIINRSLNCLERIFTSAIKNPKAMPKSMR